MYVCIYIYRERESELSVQHLQRLPTYISSAYVSIRQHTSAYAAKASPAAHTHTRTYTRTHTHIHTYIYMYIYTHTYIHTYILTAVRVREREATERVRERERKKEKDTYLTLLLYSART
jgi:hypothetical protein